MDITVNFYTQKSQKLFLKIVKRFGNIATHHPHSAVYISWKNKLFSFSC